jgi:Zn-dependent peptidase ImmA (M78 family)
MATLLGELRALAPMRPLSLAEGFGIAEIQAQALLAANEVISPPVPDQVVTDFPKVRVSREAHLPVSGASQWAAGTWAIVLNADEPQVRQRFTMAHELKHILDAIHTPALLYPAVAGLSGQRRTEQVCDFFAACLLMPRPLVKKVYCDERVQEPLAIARRFGVSQVAMRRRLVSLGLIDSQRRCLTATSGGDTKPVGER